jgi:hypothetical protein
MVPPSRRRPGRHCDRVGPLVQAWRATAADYPDEELQLLLLLLEFQRRLEDIVRGQLARLRSDLDQRARSRG